jgi:hypothetical protein
MLRITIELVPGGRERDAEVIGRGSIANVSDLSALSDYAVKFEEHAWRGQMRGPYAGTLSQWPRNERGAWEIVCAALQAAIPPVAASKKPRVRKKTAGR